MAIQIYPVQKCELEHDGYSVKINGKEVDLNVARVSAHPFNRRWPGHQRSLDQTELINFLSFATDEPVTLEIKPRDPFEKVIIRPMALGIEPEITEDGRIIFTLPHPQYCTVEPYGRHNALHIFADPVVDYGVDFNDPKTIYYGPGEHDVGLIELHEGETLYLDAGAVVYSRITAIDADNIRILGHGILDGSRNKAEILFEASHETTGNFEAVKNCIRHDTVKIEYCDHVVIDGITIRDSCIYNIRPMGCYDLTCRNIKIVGNWRYNSDGIDMHNCDKVLIDSCFIRTFDDCICIKGFDCYYEGDVEQAVHDAMYRNGKSYDIFRDVLVKNCVIWNDWGKCLEIGAETRATEMYDVLFTDCDIIHVLGNALDCCNADFALVRDITYRNIRVEMNELIPGPKMQMTDADTYGEPYPYFPPVIDADVTYWSEISSKGEQRGINRNILFEDIYVYGNFVPTFTFVGHNEKYGVEDVTVRNVYMNDKLLTDPSEYNMQIGPFCKNVKYEFTK